LDFPPIGKQPYFCQQLPRRLKLFKQENPFYYRFSFMLEASFPAMLALLSIGEFFSDMVMVLKIFVLLTIISWVVMHLGKGPLAIVLIIGVSWFVLFDMFWLFGGTYVLMMMLTLGVAGIFIDLFFVFPGFASGAGIGAGEAKMSSQGGVNQRMQMFAHPPGGRKLPPPM
jgi:hypothetical protein